MFYSIEILHRKMPLSPVVRGWAPIIYGVRAVRGRLPIPCFHLIKLKTTASAGSDAMARDETGLGSE